MTVTNDINDFFQPANECMPGLSAGVRLKWKAEIIVSSACVKHIKIYSMHNASVGTSLHHLVYSFTQFCFLNWGICKDASLPPAIIFVILYFYVALSVSLLWELQWLSANIWRHVETFRSRVEIVHDWGADLQEKNSVMTSISICRRHPWCFLTSKLRRIEEQI